MRDRSNLLSQVLAVAGPIREQIRAAEARGEQIPSVELNAQTVGDVFSDFDDDGVILRPSDGGRVPFSVNAVVPNAYVPPQAEGTGRQTVVFSEGANQWADLAARRMQRMADRLGMPIVAIHNASLVQEDVTGTTGEVATRNRQLEQVATILQGIDVLSEGSVNNLKATIDDAIANNRLLQLSGYSQGAALVGQALKRAKADFIAREAPQSSVEVATARWEEQAGRNLKILTFGNVYDDYSEGPQYLHVSMKGDQLVESGTNPATTPASANVQYILFEQLFPDLPEMPGAEGEAPTPGGRNFENHNIMVLIELLRETMQMNGMVPGDMNALFDGAKAAFNAGTSLTLAQPNQVVWPNDMQDQMWDANNNFAQVVANYRPVEAAL